MLGTKSEPPSDVTFLPRVFHSEKQGDFRLRVRTIALAAAGMGALLSANSAIAQNDTSGGVETIVVTGSRIPTPEADSPSPVQSLNALDIQHSGTTNLTDYLRRIPALTGSMGDLASSGLNTLQTDAGSSLSGLNLLDLRNLGFDRTLVLEDSQRIVSSSAGDAAVDINTIPITLIDRVDVVTGGSSAVYGADGVSGVVNFIMKHDLEGVDARVQAGLSQDGGNNKYSAAVSVGHNFDNGNGNIELTFEDTYQSSLSFQQRSFSDVGGASYFVQNPANPDGTDASKPALIATTKGGIYYVDAIGSILTNFGPTNPNFLPNYLGNGQKFNPGTIASGEFNIGGDGLPNAAAFAADFAPIEHREIAQFTGDEQFSRWFKLSAEFRFSHVDTKSDSEPSFNEFATILPNNPFLPADVRNAMLTGPGAIGEATFGSYPYETPGLVLAERVSRDVYRGVLGLDGDLPAPEFIHDAKYDIHYVYGQSDIDDVVEHNLIEDRYYAALNSVEGPNGPTCASNLNPAATPPTTVFGDGLFDEVVGLPASLFGTTFTPGPNSGCAAYNPFVANSPSNAAAFKFMTASTPTTSFISQQDLNGFASFDFPQFQDWGITAKPISFVLGGEYREEVSKTASDPATRQMPIPGEPGSTESLYFDSGGPPVAGRFHVSEAFGETSIPVFEDQPLAKELTFDFAGRVSDYSTAGTDETWKLGGVYSPISGIKFRATDAVAVRAPNIGELFAPLVQGFQGINDPCDPQFIGQGTQYREMNCQILENALLGPGNYTAGKTPVQQSTTLPVFVGGNEKLAPETARTLTLGTVIQPDFFPDLTLTVDWYRVRIADAIDSLSGQTIANQCVDLSTIDNPFCAAVTRNGNGTNIPGSIKQVIAQEINVASFFTQGVDFTASYHANLDDWFGSHVGFLDLHLLGNHMDILSFTPLAGQAPVNTANVINGGADGGPAPYWQGDLDAVWTRDEWTVDYNVQWADALLNTTRQTLYSEPNNLAKNYLHTPAQDIHSIQVGYQINDGWQVYAGINNLWYQKPSVNDYANGYPADPTGRLFYAGLQVNLNPW
jgi:outer membrane receptor protein involved in Fe transport